MPPVPALHILQKSHCISLVQKQSHAPLWTNHCSQGTNGPNYQGWSLSTGSHGNTTWKIGIIFFKPCSYFIYVTVALIQSLLIRGHHWRVIGCDWFFIAFQDWCFQDVLLFYNLFALVFFECVFFSRLIWKILCLIDLRAYWFLFYSITKLRLVYALSGVCTIKFSLRSKLWSSLFAWILNSLIFGLWL